MTTNYVLNKLYSFKIENIISYLTIETLIINKYILLLFKRGRKREKAIIIYTI
jgi:hypothetical protein